MVEAIPRYRKGNLSGSQVTIDLFPCGNRIEQDRKKSASILYC